MVARNTEQTDLSLCMENGAFHVFSYLLSFRAIEIYCKWQIDWLKKWLNG